MTAVISARGVAKRWGSTTALADVTLDIGAGVTGLLGPNGAGKTTFLGLVLGLHPPDGGTLEVLGLDPRAAGAAVRQRIGYVPEYDALPADVRAQDFVRHMTELHGLPPRESLTRASETLQWVGLGEERLRAIGTLSTGQRQRIKLAQSIAHDPALVLLDEPTNGLDPLQRDEVLALIRRMGHELGMHVVVSTHLLQEVERTCDAVVILRDGLASGGTLADLGGVTTEYVVEVAGDPASLAGALTAAGLDVRQSGSRRLLVGVPSQETLDVIRDAVADVGAPLRRLQPARRSLEDVYLDEGIT